MGRATQGVTLIAVEDGTRLSGLQRVMESDVEEAELGENGEGADNGEGTSEPSGEQGDQ
jgi:DNA gyrase subunit A